MRLEGRLSAWLAVTVASKADDLLLRLVITARGRQGQRHLQGRQRMTLNDKGLKGSSNGWIDGWMDGWMNPLVKE